MQTIKIDEEIGYWGISAYQVKEQLENMSGDITVEINSPGGSVYEGIAIHNALKAYDKGSVETVIVGLAASMASYIALAGDTVKAYDNAVYMIHNASVCLCGDFNYLRKRADVLEGLSSIIKNAYISKTGKSSEDLQKMMDDETYFFGAELFENGFIDEIIETTNNVDDSSQSKALASESFKACMQNVQLNTKEDTELIAAVTKDLRVNSASAKIKIKKEEIIVDKKYTQEEFEAKKAETAEATRKDERARVAGIMALGGNQEFTQKAIEDGSTVGDSAIALLKVNQETQEKAKTDFEAAANEVDGVVQGKSEDLTEAQLEEKAWKDAAQAKYGGDKK